MRENWRSILLYILSNAVSGQFQACNYSIWCSIMENCCLPKRTPLHLVMLPLIVTVCSVTGAAGCVASHPLDTIKVIKLGLLLSYNVVCGVTSSIVHFDNCIVVQAFDLDNELLSEMSPKQFGRPHLVIRSTCIFFVINGDILFGTSAYRL